MVPLRECVSPEISSAITDAHRLLLDHHTAGSLNLFARGDHHQQHWLVLS